MWQTLERSGGWHGKIWNRRKTSELFLELLIITAIRDDNHQVSHYASLFADIGLLWTPAARGRQAITRLQHRVVITTTGCGGFGKVTGLLLLTGSNSRPQFSTIVTLLIRPIATTLAVVFYII